MDKKLIGVSNGYKVYAVDAFAIRNSGSEGLEFDSYSIPSEFPTLIPVDEIWLAATLESEWPIFLAGAHKWIETGEYEQALFEEKRLRGGLAGGPIESTWYLRYVKTIIDRDGPLEVWFVDGKKVRDNFKTDFSQGGHWFVYPWVPKNQIWLADTVPAEWPYLLIHEYTELCLMRDKNLNYSAAHELANKAEAKARKQR